MLGPCVCGQPVLAPWQHALQHDPRLRRERLAKQAAGGHLVDAEDYVDAVYMALAASPRPGNRSVRRACGTRPADQVDGVYVVLGGLRKPG